MIIPYLISDIIPVLLRVEQVLYHNDGVFWIMEFFKEDGENKI